MLGGAYKLYRDLLDPIAMPAYTYDFLRNEVGKEYGITTSDKLKLIKTFKRNTTEITSATSWLEHLTLATYLLKLPKTVEGDVVECGCFRGASTSTLSILCGMTGRKLIVCDSFEGLPEIEEDDRVHESLDLRRYETYAKGEYAGPIDVVKGNVAKYGKPEVCEYVKGYFENSLPGLDVKPAFIFLDVDLHSSLRDCLLNLWPKLSDWGMLFTHEAKQLDYVKIFFNDTWWKENLDYPAPGLVGAGSGLPAGMAKTTGLGYALKKPKDFALEQSDEFTHFCGDPTLKGA